MKSLGKYEVLGPLSSALNSESFLAFQRGFAGFRKLVVVRKFAPDPERSDEADRAYVDHLRIVASLTHPFVAQVLDLEVHEGKLLLVTEFVPGASTAEIAEACQSEGLRIPVGLAVSAIRDAALALHHGHTFTDPVGQLQQVIHGHLTDRSVRINFEGTVKVTDFGHPHRALLDEDPEPRTDVFLLGAALHRLLSGFDHPFGNEWPAPSNYNTEVPPELDGAVLKALSPHPWERHKTASDFARELTEVMSSLIWDSTQTAQLIQRLFAPRREQMREMLSLAVAQQEAPASFKSISASVPVPVSAIPEGMRITRIPTRPQPEPQVEPEPQPEPEPQVEPQPEPEPVAIRASGQFVAQPDDGADPVVPEPSHVPESQRLLSTQDLQIIAPPSPEEEEPRPRSRRSALKLLGGVVGLSAASLAAGALLKPEWLGTLFGKSKSDPIPDFQTQVPAATLDAGVEEASVVADVPSEPDAGTLAANVEPERPTKTKAPKKSKRAKKRRRAERLKPESEL